MEFNPSKSQVIHVTKTKHLIKHLYLLHGQNLDSVPNAKYLGLDLSSDPSFHMCISRITTRANKTLGFLKCNITTKNEMSNYWLTRPWSGYRLSMLLVSGVPIQRPTFTKQVEMVQRWVARWVKQKLVHSRECYRDEIES